MLRQGSGSRYFTLGFGWRRAVLRFSRFSGRLLAALAILPGVTGQHLVWAQFDGGVPVSGGYRQGCIGHDIPIRGPFRFAPQGVYRRIVCTGDFAVILEPRRVSRIRFVLAEVTAVNPGTLDMTLEVKADNNPQSEQYVGQPISRNLRASAPDLRFSRDFGGDDSRGEMLPPYLEQNPGKRFAVLFERVAVKDCPLGFVRGVNLHSQIDLREGWHDGCHYRFVQLTYGPTIYSQWRSWVREYFYLSRNSILLMKFHSPIQDAQGNFFASLCLSLPLFASLCLYRNEAGGHAFAQCDDVEGIFSTEHRS